MTRVNLYDLSDKHIAAFDLEAPKPPGSIRWGDRVFVRSKAGLYQESPCVLIEHPARMTSSQVVKSQHKEADPLPVE